MKLFILFSLLLNLAHAGELLDTRILKIVDATEDYSLAYGEDGRVYKVRNSESDSVGNITAILDVKNNWLYPIATNNFANNNEVYEEEESFNTNFRPTNIGSIEEAEALFKTMYRRAKKKSQCYMRAHAWSYDLYRDHGINNEKIFIFFTRSYIVKYDFEWWFHVAPMVRVQNQAFVMDRKYMRGPTTIKDWTDFFMKNDALCTLVNKYHPDMIQDFKGSCFLRIVPMYFWQPLTINEHDNGVKETLGWDGWQIATSKDKAFRNYPR